MANVNINAWGIVLELPEEDVSAALTATGGIPATIGPAVSAALVAANVAAPLVAAIVAAIAAYFGLEALLIKGVDRGCGVYLTLPWPAIYLGQVYLIIPTTRPCSVPPTANIWSKLDAGQLGTSDAVDLIDYTIEHGVVGADVVTFRLRIGTDPNKSSGWAKIVVMPDGQGSQWDIKAEGRGALNENSLYANQVQNGQYLTFKKPKTFGIWTDVLHLGDLNNLRGGDRVTFVWTKDQ